MDGRAEGERHALPLQLLGNVTRIRNGAGQTVQLRHDQRVALAKRGQRLREAGPVPSGSGQSTVRAGPVLATSGPSRAFRCASRSRAWVEQRAYPILIAMAGPYGKGPVIATIIVPVN